MACDIAPVPAGCRRQTTGLREFQFVSELPPAEVVACSRTHAEAASRVLGHSYDNRYSPSTFVEEADEGYQVGWYDCERQHVRRFKDFSEALADYLLFSFGKGRLAC